MEPTQREKIAEAEIEKIKLEFSQKQFTIENLRQAILHIAEALLGVSEIGNTNKGYFVNKFLKDVALGGGNPWCLAFIQYVYRTATQIWQKNLDILPYNSGSTKKIYDHYEKLGFVHTIPEFIFPGDIITWKNGTSWQGHVGIVKSYDTTTKLITTYEGNTNSEHSRDGGDIAMHTFDLFKYGPIGKTRGLTSRYTRGFISYNLIYGEYISKYDSDELYKSAKINQLKSESF